MMITGDVKAVKIHQLKTARKPRVIAARMMR